MPISFTKVKLPYGWLGNMAAFPVAYKDQEWRTTEALFQALRFNDPEIQELIRLERSPMGAKMKAKANADKMVVRPMSEQDLANMELMLQLKVEQHPQLVTQLLETGDEVLIEDVTSRGTGRHLFWGMALKNGEWVGQNKLGNLWMDLRDKLRKVQNGFVKQE